MVESGRHTAFFVSATAAVIVTVAASTLWAQPPVARPQPPPKAPAPTTTPAPAPAMPATNTPATGASTPSGGTQSGTSTPAATPTAPPTARPTSPARLTQNPPAAAAPAPAPVSTATPPRSGTAADQPPTEAALGVPILPNAHYIGSYDAGGAGQRFYLFGTPQRFDDVVGYYRTVLRDKGELVFEIPATHMFEVGKFREDQVAFPPGVTVKDYTFAGSSGLANPRPGASPVAFPTIIQIVPPASAQPARVR